MTLVPANAETTSRQPTKKGPKKVSPMMQQYLSVKSDYADALVFFRVGDFYELLENARNLFVMSTINLNALFFGCGQ